MKNWFLFLGIISCFWLPVKKIQAQSTGQTADILNSLYGNYAPADLSAPSLLDVKADKVSKPSSVKNFTGDLIQSFESFKGVGVELAPFMFLHTTFNPADSNRLASSIHDYRKTILLRGLTLSGASVSNDTISQAAAGVGWVLYDGTDPLLVKGYAESYADSLQQLATTNKAKLRIDEFSAIWNPEIELILTAAGLPINHVNHDAVYNALSHIYTFPSLRGGLTPALDEPAKRREPETVLQNLIDKKLITTGQKSIILTRLSPITEAYVNAYAAYGLEADNIVNKLDAQIKRFRDAFEKQKWNASVYQVGGGQVWRSGDKKWNSLHKQSFGVFARAAIRPSFLGSYMSHHGLLILNTQYKWGSGDSLKSSFSFGARLTYGNSRFRVAVQHSWQNRRFQETEKTKRVNPDQWYRTFTIGPEFRVSDNLWVELAFGSSSLNKSASLLTIANVKYSFRKTDAFTAK